MTTDAPRPDRTDSASDGPEAEPPTVVLVDDEPSVLSALRRLFRMNGFRTRQANGGAEGLALLAEEPADIVISDMRMPEMDGAAFLEAVKEQHPDSMRLLLTGYADIGSTVAAINRGQIHRYIAKPWDDQDLLLTVRETLRRRELERENAALLALTQRQNAELQDLNRNLEARVKARTSELEQINQMLEAAYEEMDANFTMAITVFSGLLEMRQGAMAGHARRVSDIAGRMARKLGLDSRQQQDVVLGALLHDIGKLGFNDAMLKKPVSEYTPQEQARYQRHTLDGEAALMSMDKLRNAAVIVRQHHERFDGRGFPDQLAGDDIHIGARIVAVASDYDALEAGSLAVRAYSAAQARKAMHEGINAHYEDRVVEALYEALDELAEEREAEIEIESHQLKPLMVLSADLKTQKGAILLPAGFKFDQAMIQRVIGLADRFGVRMMVRVFAHSVDPNLLSSLQKSHPPPPLKAA